MKYEIKPVSKPRMVRSDSWKKRKCVTDYWAYKDECKLKKVTIENGDHIIFRLPIPKSRLKENLAGQPHQQRPDVDNLAKGLMDAVLKEDSHIFDIRITKLWGHSGSIEINKMNKSEFRGLTITDN